MKPKEINEIMEIFSGKTNTNKAEENYIQTELINDDEKTKLAITPTNILLSTTLIEVGVNIPEATLIVIEDAQRFGLSQLHQLRGRVGRSHVQSYCILIYNPKNTSATGRQRLQALKNSNDGFYIAEQDLKIRGGGELNGLKQSGFDNYKIADIRENAVALSKASDFASEITKKSRSFNELNNATQQLLTIFNVKEIDSGGF